MEEKNELMCELQDILNRVHAFNASHKEGVFVFSFVGFKDSDEVCSDCGSKCMSEYDENKSIHGAYGHIDDVRQLLNMLRDMVEDIGRDEDDPDFINL